MRRKDREITDIADIKDVLRKSDVLRIALNNGIYPYILPVNFGFEMNGGRLTLFFHGSKEGAKHAIIENDPHVAFEVDRAHKLIPPVGDKSCTASFAYESVIGQGLITKADDTEKEELLSALLNRYGIETKLFSPIHLANTVVYKITAETYTAKRRESTT